MAAHVADGNFEKRIREFSHYYTREVENLFLFLFGYLDKCPQLQKDNSTAINLVSGLAKIALPELGNVIAVALRTLKIHIKKKDAKRLSKLLYFFDENREEVRKMLIQASVEIGYCLEHQFRVAALRGKDPRSVMRDLGQEAAERTFAYFLEVKPEQVTKDDFTQAVIFGQRISGMLDVEEMKTAFTGKNEEWTLDAFIKRSGLVEDSQFFTCTKSDSQTYGFRRLFSWETFSSEAWTTVAAPASLHHDLLPENLTDFSADCFEYVTKKNPENAAQLDRDNKHQQSTQDRQDKYEELVDLLEEFREENAQLVEALQRAYEDMKREVREENRALIEAMRQQGERRETELRCDQYERRMKVTQTSNDTVTQWESEEDMKNLFLRLC